MGVEPSMEVLPWLHPLTSNPNPKMKITTMQNRAALNFADIRDFIIAPRSCSLLCNHDFQNPIGVSEFTDDVLAGRQIQYRIPTSDTAFRSFLENLLHLRQADSSVYFERN